MADVDSVDARVKLGELREEVRRQRRQALEGAMTLAATAHLRQEDADSLEFALGRVEQLDRRLTTLSAVTEVREPDLYRRGGPHSFFTDLAAVAGAPVHSVRPLQARERLDRHDRHERLEATGRDTAARRQLTAHGVHARDGQQSPQTRALSTGSGAGGEFAPPRWLVEEFATTARAANPLRNLVATVDLPGGCVSLVVPRFTASVGVVPDAVENTVPPDLYSTSDEITSRVATFAGEMIVSQQLFDRGGMFDDQVAVRAFAVEYAASLAQQMSSGTGANGQLLGLLGAAGHTVTYTTSTPVPANVVQAIAQAAAQVSDTRLQPPTLILMRGARYFWLAGSADASGGEPVQRLGVGAVPSSAEGAFGPLAGLSVYHDNTLPADLGAGANQDLVIVARGEDLLLAEDPTPRFSAFPQSGEAGQLTTILSWHQYTAFVPGRWPSGIAVLQGTGLATPSGF